MDTKFEILLTLNLDHDFYSNKEYTDIEIIPHPLTSKFLKNHRILFKRSGSKCMLVQEGNLVNGEWLAIIEITEPVEFVFQFKVNDILFQSKTDIDYFTNKTSKISVEVDKSGQDIKLLSFIRGEVLFDNSNSLETNLYSIEKSNGEFLEERHVGAGSEEFITLEKPGVYQIKNNGTVLSEVLWSTHDQQYDGFIFMNYKGGIDNEYGIVFSARNIIWRYALKSKYLKFNPSEQEVRLKEEEGRIEFELESEIDGYFHFVSKEPIELHDELDYSFYIEVDGEKEYSGIGIPNLSNIYRSTNDKLVLINYVTI